MSEEKIPTSWEEFQRARREAFCNGADYILCNDRIEEATWYDRVRVQQRKRYPIRKKVPRVVTDSTGFAFCAVKNNYDTLIVQRKLRGDSWADTSDCLLIVDEERVRIWADLLANPFEEIDE